MKLLFFTILFLVLSLTISAADYYASVSGTGSTCSIGSPCALQTALNNQAVMGTGDTLWLRGGTYAGKFTSALDGGTVRSYTGEWAIIDGFKSTTLVGGIDSSVTSITVASTSGFLASGTLRIDDEIMQVSVITSSTTMNVNRGWDGTSAAAHSNGASVRVAGAATLTISGGATTYRDFEVKSSETVRDATGGLNDKTRGAGISVTGAVDGSAFINLVLHDNVDGIFIGSSTSNTTVYGNIIYNNGMTLDGSSSGIWSEGHGIYTENSAGYSRIYNNIFLNNFNYNGQFYGVSGAYVGGDLQNNTFGNAGSPMGAVTSSARRNFNVLAGPNAVQSATLTFNNNYCFQPFNAFGGAVALLGYGAGIGTVTATGNYFVGAPHSLRMQVVNAVTLTGNKFYNTSSAFGDSEVFIDSPIPTGTWDNNTYYNATGKSYFVVTGGDFYQFAAWKTATGYDAASTTTAGAMPDTAIVVPNSYETGRANIVIYAPSSPSSINVNLSTTGLTNGQGYTIKNAFDYFGTAVQSGTYNSASPTISVSLTGAATSVVAPVGLGFTPATTCPSFCSLVVVPTSSAITVRYFFNAPPA